MSGKRVKISAAFKDFSSELNRLRRFDAENQTNFSGGSLSRKQIVFLTESIFFTAFREFENFIRDIFLLYTQEKKNSRNDRVVSYIKPKDFFHAESLIKSSMSFLDWNSPDTVIQRAELFLKDGFPVKLPYSTNRVKLNEYKKLRNHIAHNSIESLEGFKKVLKNHYGAIPLTIPKVGEFLMVTSRTDPMKYILLEVFDVFESMANQLK